MLQIPVQITFRHLAQSPALETLIRERAAILEHFDPHIISCRVAVELEGRHRRKGRQFVVHVDLKVSGHEIAVGHQHDEDAAVAVREAFHAARRMLEDQIRRQRERRLDLAQAAGQRRR